MIIAKYNKGYVPQAETQFVLQSLYVPKTESHYVP
jgi:hypothetical protein